MLIRNYFGQGGRDFTPLAVHEVKAAMTGHQLLEKILARDSLPSLSPIALRLMEMAADEGADLKAMARLIEGDPGLSARLLRLVNSAAYRPGSAEVTSIAHALSLLGLAEVRYMALSTSLSDTLPRLPGGPDYHLFWRSSLHRALLARLLGQRLKLPNPEEAFALGLILEMGLPLLLKVLSREQMQGFPGFHVSLQDQEAWERGRLGLDHRQVGKAVLEAWGLPRVFIASQTPPHQEELDLPILEVVDLARLGAESFFAPGVELTDIHRAARLRWGLTAEAVNQVLLDSLVSSGEVAGALEIQLNHEADLLAVMEKAQATLSSLKAQVAPRLKALLGRPQEERLRGKRQVVSEVADLVQGVGELARNLAQRPQSEPLSRQAQAVADEAQRLDHVLSEIDGFTEF